MFKNGLILNNWKMEEDELDESSTDNEDQQSIVDNLIFANQDIKNVENNSSPGFFRKSYRT